MYLQGFGSGFDSSSFLHFGVSSALYYSFYSCARAAGASKKLSIVSASSAVFAFGMLKEANDYFRFIDFIKPDFFRFRISGDPSLEDMISNSAGIAVSAYTVSRGYPAKLGRLAFDALADFGSYYYPLSRF